MTNFSSLSAKDKKNCVILGVWLISGIAMVIMGIYAIINRGKTINTVSAALGICAAVTAVLTFMVRLLEMKAAGVKTMDLDWLIWVIAAFLLFKTNILTKLGKIAFIIGGACLLLEGVRSLFAANKARAENEWYIPRIIFSAVFIALGIIVITNAQTIFEGMTVLAIGIYFIVQGINILYGWLGRVRYFRNFRGVE